MTIKLDSVSFSYNGKPVLSDFSLTVTNGERVCLVGESGAGKTTLFRLILGLEKADKGDVSVPQKISTVFQEDRLFKGVSVVKNIASTGSQKNAEILLEKAGLIDIADKSIDQLSGGMMRRIAILRALNFDADALLLDEPFNGLDDENKKIMTDMILDTFAGKPILIISHNPQDSALLGAEQVEIEKLN